MICYREIIDFMILYITSKLFDRWKLTYSTLREFKFSHSRENILFKKYSGTPFLFLYDSARVSNRKLIETLFNLFQW